MLTRVAVAQPPVGTWGRAVPSPGFGCGCSSLPGPAWAPVGCCQAEPEVLPPGCSAPRQELEGEKEGIKPLASSELTPAFFSV